MEKQLMAKVYRFDPDKHEAPFYSEYRVPQTGPMTVLDALKYINENLDETLSFRWSCGLEKCGSCAVRMNGKPVLACKATVPDGEMLVEPLPNHPVVKDLIVDLEGYTLPTYLLRPYLVRRTPPPRNRAESLKPDRFERFIRLSSCVSCRVCDSICPVRSEFPTDYAGPSAMMSLARLASDPRDSGDREAIAFDQGIFNCTGCLACTEACPKGLDAGGIIQDLKSRVVSSGMQLRNQSFFAETIRKSGSLIPPGKDRIIGKIQEGAGDLALFVGCVLDRRMQEEGLDVLELIRKTGTEAVIPVDQICCGGPLLWTGQTGAFEEIAVRNVEVFEKAGARIVIAACPGCSRVLKRDYPEALQRKPRFEVMDLREFLANPNLPLSLEAADREIVATYHDPCHLNRGLGLKTEARELLRRMGIGLVEMEGADRCCGGFAALSDPEIADRLGDQKIRRAEETGADLLVTDCPSCLQHLQTAAQRCGSKIEVLSTAHLMCRGSRR